MKDIVEILQRIHDEADHILGTEAEFPLEVARKNAESIKGWAKAGLAKLGSFADPRLQPEPQP